MSLQYGARISVYQTLQNETHPSDQVSFLWVPLGLFPADNTVWLDRERVGHFFTVSLVSCHVIVNFSINLSC